MKHSVLIFVAGIALVAVALARPGAAASYVEARDLMQTQSQVIAGFFGPPISRDVLVTGIDADSLVSSLAPAFRSTAPDLPPQLSRTGVGRYYQGRQEGSARARIRLCVGVHQDASQAREALARTVASASMPPSGPLKGVADAAVVWRVVSGTTVAFAHNNVYMSVAWDRSLDETTELIRQIVSALDRGAAYVTKGNEVRVPRVISVDLPERARLGQEATGRITLADVDPAQALIGVDWGLASPIATRIKPGEEPSITFYAPKNAGEAGEREFTLVVATPMNVITTKEIHVVVEP